MRRLAFLTLALVTIAPMAFAADRVVSITNDGYMPPGQVVVSRGESVTWEYDHDPVVGGLHGAEVDGTAESPDCPAAVGGAPSCTVAFPDAGLYRYRDPGSNCASYDSCPPQWRGTIRVDAPASPSFSAHPNPARRDQGVGFAGSANEPGMPESASTFSWDFGDGTTATGNTVSHQYAAAGTYAVTLTVTDDLGRTAATTQAISIFEPDDDADGILNKDDLCPTVAARTADGCPLPARPFLAEIDVRQTAVAALSLGGLRRDGLTAVIECTGACTAAAALVPVAGIRLAQAPAPLATAAGKLDGPGTLELVLRLTPRAKRALARVRRGARVRLESKVTDSLGRVKARTTTLVVKRVRSAKRLPQVGISDQTATTFRDPLFTVLRVRYARLVAPWNAITSEPDRLDAWLQSARAAGVRPLVSFNARRGDLCPKRPCRAPTVRQYAKSFRAFRKKYPWVRDISPWNEANHGTQPIGRKPKLAAQYYNVVRRWCRGCRIVALDLLDQNNMRRYLTAFRRHAKGKPRLWGLHNYRDTNRFRDKGTSLFLKMVPGQVWLTETGGIVRFETQAGVVALPKSEKRARRAMEFMFRLGAKHSRRIKRVYVYQWRVNFAGDRFDAGVVSPEGVPRPSYHVLSLNASAARR